jgi:hypothetical protein
LLVEKKSPWLKLGPSGMPAFMKDAAPVLLLEVEPGLEGESSLSSSSSQSSSRFSSLLVEKKSPWLKLGPSGMPAPMTEAASVLL